MKLDPCPGMVLAGAIWFACSLFMVCFVQAQLLKIREREVPLCLCSSLCKGATSFVESCSAQLGQTEVHGKHPTSSKGGTTRGTGSRPAAQPQSREHRLLERLRRWWGGRSPLVYPCLPLRVFTWEWRYLFQILLFESVKLKICCCRI